MPWPIDWNNDVSLKNMRFFFSGNRKRNTNSTVVRCILNGIGCMIFFGEIIVPVNTTDITFTQNTQKPTHTHTHTYEIYQT